MMCRCVPAAPPREYVWKIFISCGVYLGALNICMSGRGGGTPHMMCRCVPATPPREYVWKIFISCGVYLGALNICMSGRGGGTPHMMCRCVPATPPREYVWEDIHLLWCLSRGPQYLHEW